MKTVIFTDVENDDAEGIAARLMRCLKIDGTFDTDALKEFYIVASYGDTVERADEVGALLYSQLKERFRDAGANIAETGLDQLKAFISAHVVPGEYHPPEYYHKSTSANASINYLTTHKKDLVLKADGDIKSTIKSVEALAKQLLDQDLEIASIGCVTDVNTFLEYGLRPENIEQDAKRTKNITIIAGSTVASPNQKQFEAARDTGKLQDGWFDGGFTTFNGDVDILAYAKLLNEIIPQLKNTTVALATTANTQECTNNGVRLGVNLSPENSPNNMAALINGVLCGNELCCRLLIAGIMWNKNVYKEFKDIQINIGGETRTHPLVSAVEKHGLTQVCSGDQLTLDWSHVIANTASDKAPTGDVQTVAYSIKIIPPENMENGVRGKQYYKLHDPEVPDAGVPIYVIQPQDVAKMLQVDADNMNRYVRTTPGLSEEAFNANYAQAMRMTSESKNKDTDELNAMLKEKLVAFLMKENPGLVKGDAEKMLDPLYNEEPKAALAPLTTMFSAASAAAAVTPIIQPKPIINLGVADFNSMVSDTKNVGAWANEIEKLKIDEVDTPENLTAKLSDLDKIVGLFNQSNHVNADLVKNVQNALQDAGKADLNSAQKSTLAKLNRKLEMIVAIHHTPNANRM